MLKSQVASNANWFSDLYGLLYSQIYIIYNTYI